MPTCSAGSPRDRLVRARRLCFAGSVSFDDDWVNDAAQREAIRERNVLKLLAAGGNAYYLAKFAGIFGLDMQDIGAQQTGMSKDAFKAMLVEQGKQ